MTELSEEDFQIVLNLLKEMRYRHTHNSDFECNERARVTEFGKPETVRFEDTRCDACKLYDRLTVEKPMTPADPAEFARFLRAESERMGYRFETTLVNEQIVEERMIRPDGSVAIYARKPLIEDTHE